MVTEQTRNEIEDQFGQVPSWLEAMPEAVQDTTWAQMRDFQFAETALDPKTKELIGLGVSGATRCAYCTYFHTEAAKLHGATPEEINEASTQAGLTMGVSTYLNGAQIDRDTFIRETDQMVDFARAKMRGEEHVASR